MKTTIILAAALMPLLSPTPASALIQACFPTRCLDNTSQPNNAIFNCTKYTDNCYSSSKIRSCDTCNNGYTRTQQTTTVPECVGSITYYDCVYNGGGSGGGDDCDGTCDNCTSTSWTAEAEGYQKRTTATCNTATCVCIKKSEYRCAAGYYGTPPELQHIGNLRGCTKCPSSGGIAGKSIAGFNTAITTCYIPAGTSFNDSTGSGTYTGNCYYSE